MTVEVDNDRRRVVQARGRCNRTLSAEEVSIVRLWAATNDLAMGLGRW